MPKVIRVRYEKEMLKPLEPVDLEEGEVLLVSIRRPIRELFGILQKRNSQIKAEDVEKVIEEVEDESPL